MRHRTCAFAAALMLVPAAMIAPAQIALAEQGDAQRDDDASEDDNPGALDWLFGDRVDLSDADQAAIDAHPLGSKDNPIRADMPAGERAYLKRLNCDDGRKPSFERAGSVGSGPYGSIMDLYVVECASRTAGLHMDMYHPGYVELRAPEGFTIDPPKGDY